MLSKTSGKRFANDFNKTYPTVYSYINQWKEPEKHPAIVKYMANNGIIVDDSSTALSVAMMTLEAKIFKDILDAIYRKRISAVHIHDAIVIPDVKGAANVEAETIEEIMQQAYKEYGLCPTVDVTTY